MGLFSWIKNKYYEHKYNSAISLCKESRLDEAVKIFKEIIDAHPSAPQSLLDAIHKKIALQNKYDSVVNEIVKLYKTHKELGPSCMDFAKEQFNKGNYELCNYYSGQLFNSGLEQIKTLFLNSGEEIVIKDNSIDSLKTLNSSTVLLNELATQLQKKIEHKYSIGELDEAFRIAKLTYPYNSNSNFVELYFNIKFDILTRGRMTRHNIVQYDRLFDEIGSEVSKEGIKRLLEKSVKLTKERFNQKDYRDSLLLSSRLLNQFSEISEIKNIYVESTLALYSEKNNYTSCIDIDLLYSTLGKGLEFINALERFVPYANHGIKYVESVCKYIKLSSDEDCSNLLAIAKKAWNVKPDISYFISAIESNTSPKTIAFINEVVNNASLYLLTSTDNLKRFETAVCNLKNRIFIIDVLERLLIAKIDVESNYVSQILLSVNENEKNEEKLSLLNRALDRVQNSQLYNRKAEICEEIVSDSSSIDEYIENQILSLIGKHNKAEIFLTQLAINRCKQTEDILEKIDYIKKAVKYSVHHNRLFSQKHYDKKRPEITLLANTIATDLYKSGQNDSAIHLLYFLRDYKFDWFDTYGQYCLNEIKIMSPLDGLCKLKAILVEGKDTKAKILDSLWQAFLDLLTRYVCTIDFDMQVSLYKDSISFIKEECNISIKKELENQLLKDLDQVYFKEGTNNEKSENYTDAIEKYAQMNAYREGNWEVLSRFFICRLKLSSELSSSEINSINYLLESEVKEKYQKDLAYRWCLVLIKRGDFSTAIDLNTRILHSDEQIEELCKNEKLKKQNNQLLKVNKLLSQIETNELSAKDAIKLWKGISEELSNLDLVVNVSLSATTKIKNEIKKYAITKLYEQREFTKCQEGLKVQDSKYLSDLLNLRNIAIMCLYATEEGQLTQSNYKEFLSIWATAIYQPILFIKSLAYTSWDDSYTFSLNGVLGKIDEEENLPTNINYSTDIDSSIVSIKDVQKALISRMEVALKDNDEYLQFFNSQIEAMNALLELEIEDMPYIVVAPYLLQLSTSYNLNMKKTLEIEALEHNSNWETVLKVGNMYGIIGGDFSKYADAQIRLEKAIKTLNEGGGTRISFSEKGINEIRPFTTLFASLISAVTTKLNNEISANVGYMQIGKDFSQICKVLKNDNLSFIFSNYVNQSVVKELNNDCLKLAKGAKILFGIYEYCQCNPHLKRNISNIVEALVQNYITDGDNENIEVLDSFLSTTRDFDDKIVSALGGDKSNDENLMLSLLFAANEERLLQIKLRLANKSNRIRNVINKVLSDTATTKINIELGEIVDGVNNETMQKCDALGKVYNIYNSNRENKRVCENLAALIPMCIMEYIVGEKSGRQKVVNVLDSLKCNKSKTFNMSNSSIGKAYNEIWNSLSYDARRALEGTGIGTSLNSKGLALKRGLDYLKELK